MATIDMGLKEGGGAVPLSRSAGNPSNTMWPAPMSTSVPSDVFIHISSRLATIATRRIGINLSVPTILLNLVVEMHTVTASMLR